MSATHLEAETSGHTQKDSCTNRQTVRRGGEEEEKEGGGWGFGRLTVGLLVQHSFAAGLMEKSSAQLLAQLAFDPGADGLTGRLLTGRPLTGRPLTGRWLAWGLLGRPAGLRTPLVVRFLTGALGSVEGVGVQVDAVHAPGVLVQFLVRIVQFCRRGNGGRTQKKTMG